MRKVLRRSEIRGKYYGEDTKISVDLMAPNDSATTHKGDQIWKHGECVVLITSDDEESPLYGEEIRVPLADMLRALRWGGLNE